jgi:hypothetical protein
MLVMRYRAEPLRLAVLCLALLLGVALAPTAAGATSIASGEDFAYDILVDVPTLPPVEPAAIAEDGSGGTARFRYDASTDVVVGASIDVARVAMPIDHLKRHVTRAARIGWHLYDLRVSFVAPTSVLDDLLGLCHSFSADTEVLMADGTSTLISDIEAGDVVESADPLTGLRRGEEVLAVSGPVNPVETVCSGI